MTIYRELAVVKDQTYVPPIFPTPEELRNEIENKRLEYKPGFFAKYRIKRILKGIKNDIQNAMMQGRSSVTIWFLGFEKDKTRWNLFQLYKVHFIYETLKNSGWDCYFSGERKTEITKLKVAEFLQSSTWRGNQQQSIGLNIDFED